MMRLPRSGAVASAALPWLFLAFGLVLATMPMWWPLLFGLHLSLGDLLAIRCGLV